MSSHAAAALPSRVQGLLRRARAPAALALSAVLLRNDASLSTRPDLIFEAFARAWMIALAAILLVRWPENRRYERQRVLLLWALIGLSLDAYWQLAYRGPLQWAALFVKYAGVSAGLGSLIALTASFGQGDRGRVRALLVRVVAPGAFVVLFAAGLAHGLSWMEHCAGATGGCAVADPSSIWTYRAYFTLDTEARAVILLSSLLALAWSAENRQRILLVAVSCVVLAAGTAIDFTVRLTQPSAQTVLALQFGDAFATLLFTAGIFAALTKSQLFDVSFYVSRGVTYGAVFLTGLLLAWVGEFWYAAALAVAIVAALVLRRLRPFETRHYAAIRQSIYVATSVVLFVAIFASEGTFHWFWSPILEYWPSQFLPDWAVKLFIDVLLAIAGALIFDPLESRTARWIETRLMTDVHKRLERLRVFRESVHLFTRAAELERMLVDTLTNTLQAQFAHLFLRDSGDLYGPEASSPEIAPKPPAVTREHLPDALRRAVCCDGRACVPGAVLASPMPVKGDLIGFLACGPKQNDEDVAYTKLERDEITALAKEAGAAIAGLRREK